MGNTIVFQDDAFLHLLKKPGNGAAHPQTAALVHIGIEPLDLAGPVDLGFNNCAGGGHLLGFTGAIEIGAVAGYKQARWCNTPNGINDLTKRVGAAPGDQEEGVFAGSTSLSTPL